MAGEKRRLAAILVADVVGYSRAMGLDEAGTLRNLALLRETVIAPMIAGHDGRLFKTAGDGFLVEFSSAVDAVAAAVAMQQSNGTDLVLRIGIHLGDVMAHGDDLLGDGVNIAARLEGVATPGGIAVSRQVHDQVHPRLDLAFEDRGEVALKNLPRPVHVFALDSARPGPKPSGPSTGTTAPVADRPSIAVLPFHAAGADAEQEFLADGITQDIITDLARFRELFVISRNSSFTFKGKPVDVRAAATELGVRYILEGSVRQAGQRVRVTGQLIDATTGGHVWADRYDRALTDVFDLQEELTRAIVVAVAPAVIGAHYTGAARARSSDLEAHGLAHKAWSILWQHMGDADPAPRAEAARLARDCLARDPRCLQALTALAHCHWWNGLFGTADLQASIAEGLAACERALTLEPASADALLYRGMLLHVRDDHDGALSSLQQALALNVNDSRIFGWLGWAEIGAGDADRGIEHILEGRRLDPRNPYGHLGMVALAMGYFVKQDHAQGLSWALQARAASPGFAPAIHFSMNHRVGLGLMDEARQDFDLLQRTTPGYIAARLEGRFSAYRRPVDQQRNIDFIKRAGGL